MTADILAHVTRQVSAAEPGLRAYAPEGVDWVRRANDAVQVFVPWLVETAPGLARYVEDVLNSPQNVREAWSWIRTNYDIKDEDIALLDSQLRRQDILFRMTGGDIISKLVEHHLIEHSPDHALRSNGRSDYPDLYCMTFDYHQLPKFNRAQGDYGAALKGKKKRPVRVPDGLEIKTCKGAVRVDCHYPHVGMHMILQHRQIKGRLRVEDVLVAFLGKDDYHKSSRSTEATTVKYSFNGIAFVSLL